MRPPKWTAASKIRSANVQARDGAGDDEALDLGGAFEDRVDLGVTVPPLDRVLPHVAVAAEDLDRLLGDAHRRLPRLQLAHRAFAVLERLACGTHPRRTPHEEP